MTNVRDTGFIRRLPQVIQPQVSAKMANMGFLCALLVVLIHSPSCMEEGSVWWWWTSLVQRGLCQIAVPYFFWMSGFLLAGHMNEPDWYKTSVLKRVRTLLIPFVIWNALFATVRLALMILEGRCPPTWKCWFLFGTSALGVLPFGGVSMGALWFVKALIVLVLASPVCKRLASAKGVLALFAIYAVTNPYPSECRPEWFHCFDMSMISPCGWAWFTLGIYMRMRNLPNCGDRCAYGYLLGGGVMLIVRASALRLSWPWFYSCYCGWLAVPMLMIGLWKLMPSSRWPKAMLSSSFPIYLLHGFALMVTSRCQALHGNGCIADALSVIVVTFGLIGLIRLMGPRINAAVFGGR